MAIGGKFYLANLANPAKRFNYGAQMNRRIVENNIASAQSLGASFFSINSSAGAELVTLSIQMAVDRVEASVAARNADLTAELEDTLSGLDLLA